jgi:thiol-disulfide isomerase/thioredoxin
MRGLWFKAGLVLLVLMPLGCSDDDPAKPVPCIPGSDATPELTLVDLGGKIHDVKDELCENMVLLDFGATWCQPCGRGLPTMQALHEAYPDGGLKVLAVNVQEDLRAVRHYFATQDVTFPVLLDCNGDRARAWDITVIPTYILVSREGREISRIEGYDLDRIDDLEADIKTHLAP